MSIEKDWEIITRLALDPDHTTRYDRCMVDLHERLAAVQTAWDDFSGIVAELSLRLDAVEKRLGSIQSDVDVALDAVIEKEQTDPSEWAGDLVMGWDATTQKQIGPEVYTGLFHGYHWLFGEYVPVDSVRPATDEERIKYKGEPPTVNGELCMVRSMDNHSWETMPRRFVGLTDDGRFVTQWMWGVNLDLFAWEKARRLTPFELKQHHAGQEKSK